MMRDINTLIEAIAAPAMLAMLGGLARACRFGATSWKQFSGGIIISGFTGVVVHLLLQDIDLSPSIKSAIVATAGYSGGAIMDALVDKILSGVRNLPVPGAEVPLQTTQQSIHQQPQQTAQECPEAAHQPGATPTPQEAAMPWQDYPVQPLGQTLNQPVATPSSIQQQ
ncbi:phage holin family protein [Desulfovibrio cuneatus]|uniref:phage holin family protein n=1 Tax=Desulfovibrio cuneatus TaxID=159728 RepID=UPI0004027603|nr:phage holin family protein [Desulfovibrio cuneatus]